MSKEEKVLALCNAISYYMISEQPNKSFYLLEKFIEPVTDRITQLETELQMLHDYIINKGYEKI